MFDCTTTVNSYSSFCSSESVYSAENYFQIRLVPAWMTRDYCGCISLKAYLYRRLADKLCQFNLAVSHILSPGPPVMPGWLTPGRDGVTFTPPLAGLGLCNWLHRYSILYSNWPACLNTFQWITSKMMLMKLNSGGLWQISWLNWEIYRMPSRFHSNNVCFHPGMWPPLDMTTFVKTSLKIKCGEKQPGVPG